MAWLTTSKALIIKHRAYSINAETVTSQDLSQLIDEMMTSLDTNLPDMVAAAEADLATLETLDATLTTEQGSTNSTLIKAGSLAWSDNQSKTGQIGSRYESIRARIARLLSQAIVSESATVGGWGSGSLMRG